jgi:small basic protein
MVQIIGLVIGILIGVLMPVKIPAQYSNYVAVGIMAALDSVFGGISAILQKRFDIKIFLSGFFGNAILAALLAYIGDKLGIQIYLAAIFAFGNRIFINFGIIRRILLKKPNDPKTRSSDGAIF